jgi:CCR4-NOT transcription complex subunit 4
VRLILKPNKSSKLKKDCDYSAYVSFAEEEEAAVAILCLDNSYINNCLIKASYGTTKYCTNVIKNSICKVPDCHYLHSFAKSSDLISRVNFLFLLFRNV